MTPRIMCAIIFGLCLTTFLAVVAFENRFSDNLTTLAKAAVL